MELEINGIFTFKDYLQLELYQKRYSFLGTPLLATISVLLLYQPLKDDLLFDKIILLSIPTIGAVIGLFLLIFIMERRNYTSLNERFHKRRVRITEKEIYYGIPESQGSTAWSEIKKGVFFNRLIILYTKNNQPLIIPKHFFSSATEEKEWIDFIKKHVPN